MPFFNLVRLAEVDPSPFSSPSSSKFEFLVVDAAVVPFFPRDGIDDDFRGEAAGFSIGLMRFATPPPRVAWRCEGRLEVIDVLLRALVMIDDDAFEESSSS